MHCKKIEKQVKWGRKTTMKTIDSDHDIESENNNNHVQLCM